jgi:hypothetical protein
MIYGDRDAVTQADNLAEHVPHVEENHLAPTTGSTRRGLK